MPRNPILAILPMPVTSADSRWEAKAPVMVESKRGEMGPTTTVRNQTCKSRQQGFSALALSLRGARWFFAVGAMSYAL